MAERLRTATRALVVGMSESGKSKLLADYFVSGHPRVITLDVNGEAADAADESTLVADGWRELLQVLQVAARWDAWHIAAYLPRDDDVRRLFRLLLQRENAYADALARRLGGVGIECGEVSTLNHLIREKESILAQAWTRGRHQLLSLFMAGHGPHRVDKIVREQSDYIAAFMQTEPADVLWLQEQLGRAAGDEIRALQQYELLWWRKGSRTFEIYDARRRLVRIVRLDGHVEWQRAADRADRRAS